MYYVDNFYLFPFYYSKIFNFYFDNLKIGVIDIETTGLNPAHDKVILGGLVIPEAEGLRAIQFFSESPKEESLLLDTYLEELNKLDVLISYNGDHFDLPFLERRSRHNDIRLTPHQSFDLYRILDRYSPVRKLLPNLKQKTVEAFMGLWTDRTDEISGADSVHLYNQYLRTKDSSIRDTIMLHNMDDILQLSRLVRIIEKLDLHKIMFNTGFIVSKGEKKLFINNISLKKDCIQVTGIHRNIDIDYRYYGFNHEFYLSPKNGIFYLKINYKNTCGRCSINIEDFSVDCSILNKYPGCQNGILIVKGEMGVQYAEINHLIKIILKETVEEL